jgi:hypothetical protein
MCPVVRPAGGHGGKVKSNLRKKVEELVGGIGKLEPGTITHITIFFIMDREGLKFKEALRRLQ